ncbi:MAG: hypothetical protein ACRELF_21795 [Gemmataceae bacterium]
MPEGIADPSGHTGFFASASGGIEVIDLASGKVLWQTHEAQRPLLLDGDRLLAQAGTKRNRLRILRFDPKRRGECDFESDPVVFPAWVVTGEAHGHSFAAHWQVQKHHLVLDWEANACYVGKTRPTAEEALAARKHAAGIARIDLRTGQVEIRSAEKEETTPLPPLPDHLEKKAHRWQGLVGPHRKVLTLDEENGQQCFVLHSWDRRNQTEQTPKELLRGKRLLARATLDEQVLCLREASPSPDERLSMMPKKESGWWWLFSVRTGELLGRIPDEAGMHALAVLGKRVFYLVPGTFRGSLEKPSVQPEILRVLDLSSGKKLWEHPVAGKLIAPPPL